jgi:O-antigen/teichoic acid export membrane protein
MHEKLASVALRAISLVSRFALTAYLAKVFTLQDFGVFAVLVAAVYMAPVVFGFGLHYRVNRDFVAMPHGQVARVLVDKALVSLLFTPLIVASGAALWWLYMPGPVAWGTIGLLGLIGLAELILADMNFALLSVGRTALANLVQFIRNSAWIVPFFVAVEIGLCQASIGSLLAFWAVGQVLSLLTFLLTTRSWAWPAACHGPRGFRYLMADFATKSLPVYFSDLGLVGTQYADRFLIGAFLGVERAGIYVYYWTLANGVAQLLNTGVVQPALPRFVAAFNAAAAQGLLDKVRRDALVATAVFLPLVPLVYWPGIWLTGHLGKAEIAAYGWVLLVLLAGFALRTLSDLLGYGLYAARADRLLVFINMFSFAVILAVSGGLTFAYGLTGAAAGFVIASAMVLLMKYTALFKGAGQA